MSVFVLGSSPDSARVFVLRSSPTGTQSKCARGGVSRRRTEARSGRSTIIAGGQTSIVSLPAGTLTVGVARQERVRARTESESKMGRRLSCPLARGLCRCKPS